MLPITSNRQVSPLSLESKLNVCCNEDMPDNPKKRARRILFDEPAGPDPATGFNLPPVLSTLSSLEIQQVDHLAVPLLQTINFFNRTPSDNSEATKVRFWEKRPAIIDSTITLNGTEYPLEFLNSGKYHNVYAFAPTKHKLIIDNRELEIKRCVLKTLNFGNIAPKGNDIKRLMDDDFKAYQRLQNNQIPMPECFVTPNVYQDQQNPKNGGFWIMEKMETQASCSPWKANDLRVEQLSENAQELLAFVKKYLTLTDELQCEVINDFFPRNVMLGSKGWTVIDPSIGDAEDNWQENLFKYVWAWTGQNENVYEYLTSDFRYAKDYVDEQMSLKKKENQGKIPHYKQTEVFT